MGEVVESIGGEFQEESIFEECVLSSLLSLQELFDVKEVLQEAMPGSVTGVLLTGSVAQSVRPLLCGVPEEMGDFANAYRRICKGKMRKNRPTKKSDIDVWVCTRDVVPIDVDDKVLNVLEHVSKHGIDGEFHNLLQREFSEVYKNEKLYDDCFRKENVVPWLGEGVKGEILGALRKVVRDVDERVARFFERSLDDVVEVRAYPESVFNIRPNHTVCGGVESRAPFPYIIRDLVHRSRNCVVLFADCCIYPFREGGKVLGRGVAEAIGWTDSMERALYIERLNGGVR